MRSISILVTLFFLAQFTNAFPVSDSNTSLSDSDFAEGMTYTGPITPGGEDMTLSGTVQDIYAQIMKLNPNYNPLEFAVVREAYNKIPSLNLMNLPPQIEASIPDYSASKKRQKDSDSLPGPFIPDKFPSVRCNWSPCPFCQMANADVICDEGIPYLMSLPGYCIANGYSHARVSCSWSSGIYLINHLERGVPLAVPCTTIGLMADDILNYCAYDGKLNIDFKKTYRPPGLRVNGEKTSETGNYTVIVAGRLWDSSQPKC